MLYHLEESVKQELTKFIVTLENKLQGQENSLRALEQEPPDRYATVPGGDLLKAIVQTHINELEYVIGRLKDIAA